MARWFLNFSFSGRARRSHTWANYLAWFGVLVGLMIAFRATTGAGGSAGAVAPLFSVLIVVAIICATVDQMAMTFRRAHDTGKSGWVWVLLLIPLVNLLPLYWLLIQDSDQGANKYGPPVKQFYQPDAAKA